MDYTGLPALKIDVAQGVATVRIDSPPLNLRYGILLPSLRLMRFITEPETLAAAGADVIAAAPDAVIPEALNLMQIVHEEVRSLPQVTIGKLAVLARGGGSEFLMALDMRFAAIDKSGQAQVVAPGRITAILVNEALGFRSQHELAKLA
jgi:hypothetical protein